MSSIYIDFYREHNREFQLAVEIHQMYKQF